MIVDLGRTEAVIPREHQSRAERYTQGERVRGVLVDVHRNPKGAQVVLSRTAPELLMRLMEMEVPEIYDGTVVIRGCVRQPGDRAKVAVSSRERDVDPVGACVGMRGARVQAITRELRGERIDIIQFSEDVIAYAQNALSPAKITRVSLMAAEDGAEAEGEETMPTLECIVEEDQLSLAIGKRGQNVRLASALVGAKIDIKSEQAVKEQVAQALQRMLVASQRRAAALSEVLDLEPAAAEALAAAGFETVGEVLEADGGRRRGRDRPARRRPPRRERPRGRPRGPAGLRVGACGGTRGRRGRLPRVGRGGSERVRGGRGSRRRGRDGGERRRASPGTPGRRRRTPRSEDDVREVHRCRARPDDGKAPEGSPLPPAGDRGRREVGRIGSRPWHGPGDPDREDPGAEDAHRPADAARTASRGGDRRHAEAESGARRAQADQDRREAARGRSRRRPRGGSRRRRGVGRSRAGHRRRGAGSRTGRAGRRGGRPGRSRRPASGRRNGRRGAHGRRSGSRRGVRSGARAGRRAGEAGARGRGPSWSRRLPPSRLRRPRSRPLPRPPRRRRRRPQRPRRPPRCRASHRPFPMPRSTPRTPRPLRRVPPLPPWPAARSAGPRAGSRRLPRPAFAPPRRSR